MCPVTVHYVTSLRYLRYRSTSGLISDVSSNGNVRITSIPTFLSSKGIFTLGRWGHGLGVQVEGPVVGQRPFFFLTGWS